jgi:hypothetical protein
MKFNRLNRVGAVVLCLTFAGTVRAEKPATAAIFERMKTLAGEWKGTVEWSGARTGSGEMDATYLLSGNGSALVETLGVDGTASMTSVYHMDGADLRMTHFCGAQNQPRLKASRVDEAEGVVTFSFVDATNLKTPTSPHVSGLELRFLEAGRLRITFTFTSDAGTSYERIDLERVPG